MNLLMGKNIWLLCMGFNTILRLYQPVLIPSKDYLEVEKATTKNIVKI